MTRATARTVGVRDGLPALDDGQVLSVSNVIWATGFRHAYPWIELPVIGPDGWPMHERGVSTVPGIYFIGLPFQYSFASPLIGGVGRDARFIVDRVVAAARNGVVGAEPATSQTGWAWPPRRG